MNKKFDKFDDNELMKICREEFDRIERTPMKVNYHKLEEMKMMYIALSQITEGERAKVFMEIGEVTKDSGAVSVEGRSIVIKDVNTFISCCKIANPFEIYTLNEGRVRMDWTFNNIQTVEKGGLNK